MYYIITDKEKFHIDARNITNKIIVMFHTGGSLRFIHYYTPLHFKLLSI